MDQLSGMGFASSLDYMVSSSHLKWCFFATPQHDIKPVTQRSAWLGHLVALREDFRGVPSVEAFMASIGYDKALAKHAKAALKISKSWYKDKDPAKIARTVLKELPKAFLVEGLPASLAKKMNEWKKDAKKLGLKKRDLKAFKLFANWEKGWKSGGEAYAKLWKKWK